MAHPDMARPVGTMKRPDRIDDAGNRHATARTKIQP
jgi:hypothetical protein